jgi:hypothetical protein
VSFGEIFYSYYYFAMGCFCGVGVSDSRTLEDIERLGLVRRARLVYVFEIVKTTFYLVT